MRKLIYGMNLSLDGYIAAAGDDIGWGVPSDELFQVGPTSPGDRPDAVRAQAVADDELPLADRRPAAQRHPGGDRVRAVAGQPKVVFASSPHPTSSDRPDGRSVTR